MKNPTSEEVGFIFLPQNERLYAEKTFDNKPCKSTLGRASREAESLSAGHVQVRFARVSCCQKEIGIKSEVFVCNMFYLCYN